MPSIGYGPGSNQSVDTMLPELRDDYSVAIVGMLAENVVTCKDPKTTLVD